MGSVKTGHSSSVTFSRREFIATAASASGGLALFTLPKFAYAKRGKGVYDSLGRPVNTSRRISRVVPAGIYAQTIMETLCPEALTSLAKDVSFDYQDFADADLADMATLPETGAANCDFGKPIDTDEIRGIAPDLVVQAGFGTDETEAEVDKIQLDTGSQTVFIDVEYGMLSDSYRKLGDILDCGRRAERLASYIEDARERAVAAVPEDAKGMRIFYAPRVAGMKVNKGVGVQVSAMKDLGLVPTTAPYDYENKTVDFKRLADENPDLVLFDDTAFVSEFSSAQGEVYELWSTVPAIGQGRFAVAPALMHSVLGSAMFVQSIGMLWISHVLDPDASCLDMPSEMQEFYDLFYGLDRDGSEMKTLLGDEEG